MLCTWLYNHHWNVDHGMLKCATPTEQDSPANMAMPPSPIKETANEIANTLECSPTPIQSTQSRAV